MKPNQVTEQRIKDAVTVLMKLTQLRGILRLLDKDHNTNSLTKMVECVQARLDVCNLSLTPEAIAATVYVSLLADLLNGQDVTVFIKECLDAEPKTEHSFTE